jgi:energy-coupling factor transport system permease protein
LAYSGLFAYTPGATLFHRLSPFAKLVWVMSVWAVSLAFADVYRLTPLVVLVLGASVYSGIGRQIRSQLVFVAVTIAVLVLLQGAFYPGARDVVLTIIPRSVPVVGGWGALTGTGLLFGAAIGERFLCILFATLVGIMTTKEEDLISLLSDAFRLPYTYVMITIIALRFIPTIQGEFSSILDAQRARGFEPERMNIFRRLTTAYVPVIIPLVTGAIFKAEEVAVTMECRAFGEKKRTYRGRHRRLHALDYAFMAASVILASLYIIKVWFFP